MKLKLKDKIWLSVMGFGFFLVMGAVGTMEFICNKVINTPILVILIIGFYLMFFGLWEINKRS